jgi:GTP 3',8-cyclase
MCRQGLDYLRISITDRCNERCTYCLPRGFRDWKPREELLSYEELLAVTAAAVSAGFRKFRVTGGEPLVRREAAEFIRHLIALPGVQEVGLSTNATRLQPVAESLARAGLRRLNVSIDALSPDVYRRITGGRVSDVLAGLEAARRAGIDRIKLNTVLQRNVNEDQIWPLLEYAAANGHPLRIIELMPVSLRSGATTSRFLPMREVVDRIARRTQMVPDESRYGNGPAVYFRLPRIGATVGFIAAMTGHPFCSRCNKIRLTADGRIRPCLGHHLEFDLKPALRPPRGLDALRDIILSAVAHKPSEHLFRRRYEPGRVMTAIGG